MAQSGQDIEIHMYSLNNRSRDCGFNLTFNYSTNPYTDVIRGNRSVVSIKEFPEKAKSIPAFPTNAKNSYSLEPL